MKFKRTLNEEDIGDSDLLFSGDSLTVDELMSTLRYIKGKTGGKTRVVFEIPEAQPFSLCDVKLITFTKTTGSDTDVESYDPEFCPRNAKPTIVLCNYE